MKDVDFNDEVTKILQEVPNARKALLDNYCNLLDVSEYCYNNYIQAGENSSKALEETKKFTSQSLASIAYQISSLATSVLSLLDAQNNQLCRMESSINLIEQTVEMHKEKVSRREIGVFTTVRRVPRSHKIVPPSQSAAGTPRPTYSRHPINYQQLDSVGHGIKVSGKQAERSGTIRKHGVSVRSNKIPEPVSCPLAPPSGNSSFGKPVAPPTIPTTWQTPHDCENINMLIDEPPPPPLSEMVARANDEDNNSLLPPSSPISSFPALQVPPPPQTPTSEALPNANDLPLVLPPPPDCLGLIFLPPPPPPPPEETSPGSNAVTLCPPLCLETVVEESSSLPPPSPPPSVLCDDVDDGFPLPPNQNSGVPALPPPPPSFGEVDVFVPPVTLHSRRSRLRRSTPSTCSLSLRVRSGPASRSHHTRSLFLPAVQSLLIPPPPSYPPPRAPSLPPPLFSVTSRLCLPAHLEHLDLEMPCQFSEDGFDEVMPPLPPPVDYDTDPPAQYLEKVVALYTYEASRPEDLSITEGDIIYLTRRNDDGWYEGFLHGKQGFFPESYVQSCG